MEDVVNRCLWFVSRNLERDGLMDDQDVCCKSMFWSFPPCRGRRDGDVGHVEHVVRVKRLLSDL